MGFLDFFKSKEKNNDNKDLFKCKICNTVFPEKDRLSKHMKKAHGGKDDFMPNVNPFGGN